MSTITIDLNSGNTSNFFSFLRWCEKQQTILNTKQPDTLTQRVSLVVNKILLSIARVFASIIARVGMLVSPTSTHTKTIDLKNFPLEGLLKENFDIIKVFEEEEQVADRIAQSLKNTAPPVTSISVRSVTAERREIRINYLSSGSLKEALQEQYMPTARNTGEDVERLLFPSQENQVHNSALKLIRNMVIAFDQSTDGLSPAKIDVKIELFSLS